MQEMLVTLAATSTNALMDTNRNRRQFANIILANITRTYHLFFQNNFTCSLKGSNKFDCLIKEILQDAKKTQTIPKSAGGLECRGMNEKGTHRVPARDYFSDS